MEMTTRSFQGDVREVRVLYTKRNVYIDLSTQDERHGDKNVVGKLLKAMCGTRDAPHPRRRP